MYENIFDILRDPNNPVLLSIIILFIILAVVFLFYRYLVIPLNRKHLIEKSEFELKQTKLMALFADLDPDPVLRIDCNGNVIFLNNIAQEHPDFSSLLGKSSGEVLDLTGIDLQELIKNNRAHIYSQFINKKYYMIHIKGSASLNMAHVYLHDITLNKKIENSLKKSKQKLHNLTRFLLQSSEKEQLRIANELHDGIGQNILFLKLKMQNLKDTYNIDEKDPTYSNIIGLFDDTIKDLRMIISGLKPKILEEMGLSAAIEYLSAQVAKESKISGRTEIQRFITRFGHDKEIFIFRIVQELLNNVVKHSRAKNFFLKISFQDEQIRIVITDDGVGFNYSEVKKNNRGFGLINLNERVSSLNGILKIDSSPGTGTTIIAEIPGGKNE